MTTFRRGFKTWCESTALQYRTALRLDAAEPLPARQLAAHIGVRVVGIEQVPGLSPKALSQLTKGDPESWSGLLVAHRGINLVVINTAHSTGRQSSSLMHECSHVILNHKPAQVLQSPGGILISSYDRQQEDEADWLGGTLLLPRVALLKIAQEGPDYPEHTRAYGVSDDMLRMRLDRTGVSIQMRRRAS